MVPTAVRSRQDESDDALRAALAAGDAGALDEMLRRHWPRIVRFASHIAGCDDVAEDIAQDAFVQLWQWRKRLSGGSVMAFLHRVARNLALNEVRNREAHRRARAIGFDHEPIVSPPDEVLEIRGLEHAIDRAIAALPPRQRAVFVMARYEGLRHEEIAKILGTSPQTVANQMTSALVRLRDALRPLREAPVPRVGARPGKFNAG